MYLGWDVGSVTIKRVCLYEDGRIDGRVVRHDGNPNGMVRKLLSERKAALPESTVITGPLASTIFPFPYVPEPLCIEAALEYLKITPDILLSLGGESFVAYALSNGLIRHAVSSNRCAAGSGEFLIQQFGRMGLALEEGLQEARRGRLVALASRCSVHCKSDATHKLNKGECAPADIARSLVAGLASKIASLLAGIEWPKGEIIIAGGLADNQLLIEDLRASLSNSRIEVLEHSFCLQALGAAVTARKSALRNPVQTVRWVTPETFRPKSNRLPLNHYSNLVTALNPVESGPLPGRAEAILGIDAGSTTTKAALVERTSGKPIAWCYLRTYGDPIAAAARCIENLGTQAQNTQISIVQVAATGSGRELVSVCFDGGLSLNEILAHARAAREFMPEIDTIFEIGGQDAKFISLAKGVPVDYAMNDGCSAGTGSFLEEVCASDMDLTLQEIAPYALSSREPAAFGERCAAFINSEIRTALQQGIPRADIVAGLVYSVMENYLCKVVGARQIGDVISLQGGVALNPAAALAAAALTGRRVVVPWRPEIMGCIGAALLAKDALDSGDLEARNLDLADLGKSRVEKKGSFTCSGCENACDIKRLSINRKILPLGGLCSRWEMKRRPRSLKQQEGKDLVRLRDEIMFNRFTPPLPSKMRGRIGLPLALATYELYPFYARLLADLGYEVVLSRVGEGSRRTGAPMCFPAELLHSAVDDLIKAQVDFVFLPYLREMPVPKGHVHSYVCPFAQDAPAVIRHFFEMHAGKFISPEIGLADHLRQMTEAEVVKMGTKLGVLPEESLKALSAALCAQREFEEIYREEGMKALAVLEGPAIVLAGRPYLAYNSEYNLSIPRKIVSQGFNVIPADLLRSASFQNEHNVWHFTQKALSAIAYAKKKQNYFVCYLTCFSCTPDAIILHRLRKELEGRPFCFLEIDSQTAQAGIETRIGAFLDIIKGGRRIKPVISNSDHSNEDPAIESGRNSVCKPIVLDGRNVVHVLLPDLPRVTAELMAKLYGTMGWRAITVPSTDQEVLQAARRVCSGRECLPFLSMIGKMLKYLERRPPEEITAFHLPEQEGPCQIGNWPDAVAIIFQRLGIERAVPVWPTIKNNYLGLGEQVAVLLISAVIIGDLMKEIRSALRCLAANQNDAITILDDIEESLMETAGRGLLHIEPALKKIARRISQIPLKRDIRSAPKIFIMGGVSRIFLDQPVREFFEKQGILTKTNDLCEFVSLLESEPIIRLGFAVGRLSPDRQFSIPGLLKGVFKNRSDACWKAVRARLHCAIIDWVARRWRRILAPSGVLFAPHLSFLEVARAGHARIPANGFCESTFTVGRYIAAMQQGCFNGIVNIGAFNCSSANVATSVLRPLSNRSDFPYAVIEGDGTGLTAGQTRQLEMVAARCLV